MAFDRHVGRGATFPIEGQPDKYIGLIDRHGVTCRVQQARQCPCAGVEGVPTPFCPVCKGKGQVYRFQRKLLSADEDADLFKDRTTVKPWRVPLLEPVYVERPMSPEQGGLVRYEIVKYDSFQIKIKAPQGKPLPFHWQKLRLTYYFDRFSFVEKDQVTIITDKIVKTNATRIDLGLRSGNYDEAHGDITIVKELKDYKTGHIFTDFELRVNYILLGPSEPAPTPGQTFATYFYAPATKTLPADLNSRRAQENWITQADSAELRLALEPWYELAPGDLITLLAPQFFQEQTLRVGQTGVESLQHFYIADVDDEILGQNGETYIKGKDWIFVPMREIVWLSNGSRPSAGEYISVRFGYRPTYKVFQDNAQPNRLENKRFPTIVFVKLFNMLDGKLEKRLQDRAVPGQVNSAFIPTNPFAKNPTAQVAYIPNLDE